MGKPVVSYNVQRMAFDMAERGWVATDLARVAGVSDMTVSRFLRGERQSPRTAKRLAEALGYSIRRYLRRSVELHSGVSA